MKLILLFLCCLASNTASAGLLGNGVASPASTAGDVVQSLSVTQDLIIVVALVVCFVIGFRFGTGFSSRGQA